MNNDLVVDAEKVEEILQECGANAFAVFCAIEVLGTPCTIDDLREFTGLSQEETQAAVVQLAVHNLGIPDMDKGPRLHIV